MKTTHKKTGVCGVCGSSRKYTKSGKSVCPTCQKRYCKNYRDRNMESIRKKNRERKRRSYDPEKAKIENKVWRDWIGAGDVTRMQLVKLFEEHNESCHYCGSRILKPRFWPSGPNGFDHKVPRCSGGKHTISNIVPSCNLCNSKKGTKTYDEYLNSLMEESK